MLLKCTPPSNTNSLPSSLDLEAQARLTSINFSDNDILKIIRSLDINKAHGHDDMSVRMVKICDDAIKKPLPIIHSMHPPPPSAWRVEPPTKLSKRGHLTGSQFLDGGCLEREG